MCVHKIKLELNTNLEVAADTCDYDKLDNNIHCDSGDLSIIQHNIRGLTSKLGNINNLIEKLQDNGHPDIILLCETWLKTNSPRPYIEGYNIERNDRKHKKGGGVCILLSTRCKYKRRLDLEQHNCVSFESCFVEIQGWKSKIIVGSIYRPPNTDPREFIITTKKIVSQARKYGQKLVLGLDHNLDFLKESQYQPTHDFLETIYETGLIPTITKPTRITTSSATLIDNIVDNQLYSQTNSGIAIDDTSDHLPCYCIIRDFNPHRTEEVEITSRDTRKKNLEALKHHLATDTPVTTAWENCKQTI